jgi:hypothetical protein
LKAEIMDRNLCREGNAESDSLSRFHEHIRNLVFNGPEFGVQHVGLTLVSSYRWQNEGKANKNEQERSEYEFLHNDTQALLAPSPINSSLRI